MFCPYCGSEVKIGEKICRICGKNLPVPDKPLPLQLPDRVQHGPTDNTRTNDVKSQRFDNSSLNEGELTAGNLLDRRYEVNRKLGGGGMGSVYLVNDRRLSKLFVAKEMLNVGADSTSQETSLEWFLRESQILCQLRHPNIPVVIDFFSENTKYYLIMDYIDGKSLMEQTLPMTPVRVLDFAIIALDILQFLHEHSIIHRDIKTDHFIIEEKTGKTFLLDFGIARIFKVKTAQTAIGTIGFAPPEQYEGKADERSDIYALGAVLHHMLTGKDPRERAPFQFSPVESIVPDVPPVLASAIAKALKYNKEERFVSAKEMKYYLAGCEKVEEAYSPPEVSSAPIQETTPEEIKEKPRIPVIDEMEEDDKIFKGRLRCTSDELAKSILPPEPDYHAYKSIRRRAVEELEEAAPRRREAIQKGLLWKKNPGGGDWLADIAFLPPGNLLVASFFSGEILIIDASNGTIKNILKVKTTSSSLLSALNTCMTISDDGTRLAQGMDTSYTVVWDLPAEKRLNNLSEHTRAVTRVRFINNNKLITASKDHTIICWDLDNFAPKFKIKGDNSGVTALDVSKNSNHFYIGTESGNVFVWDINQPGMKSKGPIAQNAHRKGITDLAVSPTGDYIVTVGLEGLIRVWKTGDSIFDKLTSVASFQGHNGASGAVIFDLKSDVFITGGQDGEVKFWSPKDNKTTCSYPDIRKNIRSVSLSQNGKYLAAAGEEGTIAVWSL
jgi:serine/threonine protein kinase